MELSEIEVSEIECDVCKSKGRFDLNTCEACLCFACEYCFGGEYGETNLCNACLLPEESP